MSKILNIVETAYRATIEEQDDPILWITHSLKNAGADISILLKGNAVNYAVKGQNATGLTIGEIAVAHPPKLDQDLSDMIEKGVRVYLVKEDIEDRALPHEQMIAGTHSVNRKDIAPLLDWHDQVWHW